MMAAVIIGPARHILQRGTAEDGLRPCKRGRSHVRFGNYSDDLVPVVAPREAEGRADRG